MRLQLIQVMPPQATYLTIRGTHEHPCTHPARPQDLETSGSTINTQSLPAGRSCRASKGVKKNPIFPPQGPHHLRKEGRLNPASKSKHLKTKTGRKRLTESTAWGKPPLPLACTRPAAWAPFAVVAALPPNSGEYPLVYSGSNTNRGLVFLNTFLSTKLVILSIKNNKEIFIK